METVFYHMKKPPEKIELEEHPDGEKRRDAALANALAMAPKPFTPKVKSAAKNKKTGK